MDGISVRPSVRLSDTLRYYVKMKERRRMRSLPPGSPVSPVFCCQEWLMGDGHIQIKIECKEVDPCENSRAVHILPHNSETVIDNENSSVNANRKWNMGFPTSHQPRSCVTPNFPKMVFRCPNMWFFAEISTKILQVRQKVSFGLKTSSDKVVGRSSTCTYLSNGINILAGDDTVPVKIWAYRNRPPVGRTSVFENE